MLPGSVCVLIIVVSYACIQSSVFPGSVCVLIIVVSYACIQRYCNVLRYYDVLGCLIPNLVPHVRITKLHCYCKYSVLCIGWG